MVINSFFVKNGVAAEGLSPTISIWSVFDHTHTPVVTDEAVVEIGRGFYTYDFVTYDELVDYVVVVDAGSDMTPYGRYNTAALTPINANVTQVSDAVVDQLVSGVWDVDAVNHTTAGSTGEMLNQIKADTSAVAVGIISITQLLETLKKFENNRTKINPVAKTLTVYDNDGVTPVQVFILYDGDHAPSVSAVLERVPTI